MELKLCYFRGRGNTTAVAVKNQVLLKKLRIAKFIQKSKKKFLLPLSWYYHGYGYAWTSYAVCNDFLELQKNCQIVNKLLKQTFISIK